MTDDALRVKKIVQSLDRRGGSDATTTTLHFKVFKLRYSSQLVFENVIKACRRSVDCHQPVRPRAGSAVVRIDPLRFLAGCRVL